MARIAAVAAFWLGIVGLAQATTYSFVGTPYTTVDPPYTTSMFATGSVTTSTPFPASSITIRGTSPPFPNGLVAPITSWSFSDGVNTFTDANTEFRFEAWTDAKGNLTTDTFVRLTIPKPPHFIGQTLHVLSIESVGTFADGNAKCVSLDVQQVCDGWSSISGNAKNNVATTYLENFPAVPPALEMAFGPARIYTGSSTSLEFTLANKEATVPITGVAFVDHLPPGVTVTSPNALSNGCGGSVTADPGTGLISLVGADLAGGGTCTIKVSVTGTLAGLVFNTAGPVTSLNSLDGNTATAALLVGPSSPVPALAPWALALLVLLIAASLLVTRKTGRRRR